MGRFTGVFMCIKYKAKEGDGKEVQTGGSAIMVLFLDFVFADHLIYFTYLLYFTPP